MINSENFYPPQFTEEQLKAQKKLQERRELRGRCISTGVLCLISLFVFYVAAVSLVSFITYALENTPLLNDDRFSLIPDMLLNSLVSLIGFGVVSVIFCKVTRTDFGEILPHQNMSFKKLSAVVVIGLAISLSSNYLAQLFLTDLSIFGVETMYDDALTGSTSILEHITYIISVAIVPAVTEELIYRGCVMGRLRKYGDGFALVTSALLFGMMHGNFAQAPFAFVVGLAVGWSVIYTGSIFPAMLIHCFNNLLSVLADIFYENFELNGLDTIYVDFIFISLYTALFALALFAAFKLSKSDKNFAKLKPYEGELSYKERIKVFFTSATIIIFLAFTLLECFMTLKLIE